MITWSSTAINAAALAAREDDQRIGDLLAACAPLVAFRCRSMAIYDSLLTTEELPAAVAPQLVNALRWYDPTRCGFATVVYKFARQWALREISRQRCIPGISLHTPAHDEGEETLADTLPDETAADPSVCEYAVPLDTLSPKIRNVIERYFGLNGRPTETLAQIGPTHQYASKLVQMGLLKLRRAMACPVIASPGMQGV